MSSHPTAPGPETSVGPRGLNPAQRRLAGLLVLATIVPLGLERIAIASLSDRLGDQDQPFTADVSAQGLSLGPAAIRRGGILARADTVRVRVGLDGVGIEVEGLEATYAVRATPGADPAEIAPPGTEQGAGTETPGGAPRFAFGFPIRIDTHGTVEVDLAPDVRVTLFEPRAEIGPAGAWQAQCTAKIDAEGKPPLRWPSLRIAGKPGETKRTFSGRVEFVGLPGTDVRGSFGGSTLNIAAAVPDGGELLATIRRDEDEDRVLARAEATQFPLSWLSEVTDELPSVVTAALGSALMDGRLDLERRGSGGWSLRADDLGVSGLVLQSGRLSKSPVRFSRIATSGKIRSERGAIDGELVITHGSARVRVRGSADAARVEMQMGLDETRCQELLDSTPTGLLTVLEGMRVDGSVSGQARLAYSRDALLQTRQKPADDEVVPGAPGELELTFPFLDQCVVTRDAPDIDVAALKGSYRHRFVMADGHFTTRVLGIESPEFVPMVRVPTIGRAFVIMEDSGFWEHDGFDRDQIARAFWHNLGAGRMARGASTITQQTARNLWLGGQRTVGRKLQEAILAARLEQSLSKRRILELYLNVIELGPGIHGVRDAARYHFGKRPEDLNLLQALHLASLAPAPVTLSKRWSSGNVDSKWKKNLRAQIRRMKRHGMITREAAERALWESLDLRAHAG